MINNVSDLIDKIVEKGKKNIEPYLRVKHGPTIGDMYEGLTKEAVNIGIFKDLDIRVVSGKIENNEGELSDEIDCMIVEGEGKKLPFIDKYIWNINDVLAVIEVKKNCNYRELCDAYQNLKSVYDIIDMSREMKINLLADAYRRIVGLRLPHPEEVEGLYLHKQMIYHSLVVEAYGPLRIVLGYDGYKSEYSLREGFSKYISENKSEDDKNKGFGPTNLPHLVICGTNSLIKLNGMPYAHQLLDDDFWLFYGSYNSKPFLLMLELLWTKIAYKYGLDARIFGEDLEYEAIRPFISGKFTRTQAAQGWEYNYYNYSKKFLESYPNTLEWGPVKVNCDQFIVFQKLCGGYEVDVNNPKFQSFIQTQGYKIENFIQGLIDTKLINIDEEGKLYLLTDQCTCMISPKDGYIVEENKTGRLTRWIMKSSV